MNENSPATKKRFGCLQVLLIVLAAVIVTAAVTFFMVRAYVYPKEFKPVMLTAQEEKVLQTKLARLDRFYPESELELEPAKALPATPGKDRPPEEPQTPPSLEPEAYSEEGLERVIRFSERELNALIAKNTDLAHRLAIDLSDNLISAKLLLPMDEEVPIVGGKTLRVHTGLTFMYEADKPVVALRGVTVMGVPLPNAWIGGIKNVDLVKEFGQETGPWKVFADGVAGIEVEEGQVTIRLEE
jgi:hypothetical protein